MYSNLFTITQVRLINQDVRDRILLEYSLFLLNVWKCTSKARKQQMSDSGAEQSLTINIICESCGRRYNSGGRNGSLLHWLLSLLSCWSRAEENQMMSVIKGVLPGWVHVQGPSH